MYKGVISTGDEDPFECPECGRPFPYGTRICPGCGVELEWDEDESPLAGEVGDGELRLVDPRLLPSGRGTPGLHGDRIFSRWGLLLAVLTVLAFVGTVLLLNWDVWVRGETSASIGDTQRTLIYTGAVTTTVLAVFTIIDLLRHGPSPQDRSGEPEV